MGDTASFTSTTAAIYGPELRGPVETTGVRMARRRCRSEVSSLAMLAGVREDHDGHAKLRRAVIEIGGSPSLRTVPLLLDCLPACTEQGG